LNPPQRHSCMGSKSCNVGSSRRLMRRLGVVLLLPGSAWSKDEFEEESIDLRLLWWVLRKGKTCSNKLGPGVLFFGEEYYHIGHSRFPLHNSF